MTRRLLLIELNEISFDYVRAYMERGELPNFAKLIDAHGISQTTSEDSYDEWEPWIQWVTAHTGLALTEHQIFRLGDIVLRDIPQIWEELEDCGLRVGAVSPMNAKNRTRAADFFIPDPWTRTSVTGPFLIRKLHGAIAQAVSDNAQARLNPGSLAWLATGLIAYARPSNYARYGALIAGIRRKKWNRALLLDLLLADIFVKSTQHAQPQFASLFLNAGAHIQHHYLFSSSAYTGAFRNPEWYVRSGDDPVLDAYRLYDHLLATIIERLPDYRLMIATGLHQVAHDELTFYWRLRNHETFLSKLGISFSQVEPLMSRDFLVKCADCLEAGRGAELLGSAIASDGRPLFAIDNRGTSLFVSLVYPGEISMDFEFQLGDRRVSGFHEDVAFVAVKNGEHQGNGYFIDTSGSVSRQPECNFPLKLLPARIKAALTG